MKIHSLQGISYNNTNAVQRRFNTNPQAKHDSFVLSENSHKQVSFGSFWGDVVYKIIDKVGKNTEDSVDDKPKTNLNYHQSLSEGAKRVLGADIPPENLKSILAPNDFRIILSSLNAQNFISTKENQQKGIYSADLDYITSYSYNGIEDVFDVLDNAVEYANDYHRKTGKKFIFAIADNDTTEGLVHAIGYIGENPDKFENLVFVPAVKISFAHKAPNSNIGFENSRMLVYGVNPFSDNLNDFVDDTLSRRKNMVYDFIGNASDLYKSFIYKGSEFAEQNSIFLKKDFGQSDLYWRVKEYISSKSDIEIQGHKMTPKEIYAFSEDIFAELGNVYRGSDNTESNGYFGDNNESNIVIQKLFDQYSTHYDREGNKVESSAENVFGDFIDCLSKENEKPVLAIASPYYLSHYFEKSGSKSYDNVVAFLEFLQRKSDGMLIGFESVCPNYDLDNDLTLKKIRNFNNFIRQNTNLMEVGGSFATRNNDELPLFRH